MYNITLYSNSDPYNVTSVCETAESVHLGRTYAIFGLFFIILMMFQNGIVIVALNISADDRSVSRTIHSVIMLSAVLNGFVQIPVWIQQLSNSNMDRKFIYTYLILLPGIFHTVFMWITVLMAGNRALIMIQLTNKRFWGNQLRFIRYIIGISIICLIFNIPRMISLAMSDCPFHSIYDTVQCWIVLCIDQYIPCIILTVLLVFLTKKMWHHHKRRQIFGMHALGNPHTKYTIMESNPIIIALITLTIESIDAGIRTHQMLTTLSSDELSVSLSVIRMLRLAIYGHFFIHVITNFKLRRTMKLYAGRL